MNDPLYCKLCSVWYDVDQIDDHRHRTSKTANSYIGIVEQELDRTKLLKWLINQPSPGYQLRVCATSAELNFFVPSPLPDFFEAPTVYEVIAKAMSARSAAPKQS